MAEYISIPRDLLLEAVIVFEKVSQLCMELRLSHFANTMQN